MSIKGQSKIERIRETLDTYKVHYSKLEIAKGGACVMLTCPSLQELKRAWALIVKHANI